MKRFKTKKKFHLTIVYIGLFLISCALSLNYLLRHNLVKDNTLLDYLINDNLIKNKNNKVEFLLKYALNVNLKKDETVLKSEIMDLPLEIKDKGNEAKDYTVYIYNSHQSEQYESPYLGAYNIASDVLIASKMLKEYLEDNNIYAYVEEENITNLIHALDLQYKDSYTVSRMLLERRKKEMDTLNFFIDLHRDSSAYAKTTTTIDGKSYAKVLLVVGLEHDNYEENLARANKLGQMLKDYNPDLYRGLSKKSGTGVNGIYNQDFSPRTLLIEVGGQYNNISEVDNTLKVLAPILAKFIKEDGNE